MHTKESSRNHLTGAAYDNRFQVFYTLLYAINYYNEINYSLSWFLTLVALRSLSISTLAETTVLGPSKMASFFFATKAN